MRPNRSAVVAISASMSSATPMSHRTASAGAAARPRSRPPSRGSCPGSPSGDGSTVRAAHTTVAPSAASPRASPLPMPRDAPVTIATCPSSVIRRPYARPCDVADSVGCRAMQDSVTVHMDATPEADLGARQRRHPDRPVQPRDVRGRVARRRDRPGGRRALPRPREAQRHRSRVLDRRCSVTECEPGRVFAFGVGQPGKAMNTWSYRLEPARGRRHRRHRVVPAESDAAAEALLGGARAGRAAGRTARACRRRSSASRPRSKRADAGVRIAPGRDTAPTGAVGAARRTDRPGVGA